MGRFFSGVGSLAVLTMLGVALVAGTGVHNPAVHLAGGSAWFPTASAGAVSLVDGSTADRMAEVSGVGAPNDDLDVAQFGTSALVVDRNRGTVTKVDAASWQASPPVPVSTAGDRQLSVYANAGAAWIVGQNGTLVQQLAPVSMSLVGESRSLPAAVADATVDETGRLWTVEPSGEVRSFAQGRQSTVSTVPTTGPVALALVGDRSVVVDRGTSKATVLDPRTGQPDRSACVDVPVDPAPQIGGSGDDAPWLLAVAPATGTLIVSDVDAGTCRAVRLGPSDTGARYGRPVEHGRLVYVPDDVAGQVIVVDPAADPSHQVRARVDLGFTNTDLELLVHDDRVWFDQANGDHAGVIRDDLQALVVSKTGGGGGSQPGPAPTPTESAAPPHAAAPTPSAAPPGSPPLRPGAASNPASAASPGRVVAGSPAAATAAADDPSAAARSAAAGGAGALPAPPPGAGSVSGSPASDGASGDGNSTTTSTTDGTGTTDTTGTTEPPADSGSTPSPAAAGGAQPDFSASTDTPAPNEDVVFTAQLPTGFTVAGWEADGASPPTSATGSQSATFVTSFPTAARTFSVVLTAVGPDGVAVPVTHTITVGADAFQLTLAPIVSGCSSGMLSIAWTATNGSTQPIVIDSDQVTLNGNPGSSLTFTPNQLAINAPGNVATATFPAFVAIADGTLSVVVRFHAVGDPADVGQTATGQATFSGCPQPAPPPTTGPPLGPPVANPGGGGVLDPGPFPGPTTPPPPPVGGGGGPIGGPPHRLN
jgi:hypothetical protein